MNFAMAPIHDEIRVLKWTILLCKNSVHKLTIFFLVINLQILIDAISFIISIKICNKNMCSGFRKSPQINLSNLWDYIQFQINLANDAKYCNTKPTFSLSCQKIIWVKKHVLYLNKSVLICSQGSQLLLHPCYDKCNTNGRLNLTKMTRFDC